MNTKRVWMEEVPLDKIDLRDNVRLEEDVGSLMLSVKEQGLLQPVGLLVNKHKRGRYVLLFGYRRFKAVRNLGWASIPAKISDIEFTSESEMERYKIISNLTENGYEKPSPVEQGRKYIELMDKFKMSVEEIHALTGEPKGAINDDIFVYKSVPVEFRGDVTRSRAGGTDNKGKLPVSTVKSLIKRTKNYRMNSEDTRSMWNYVKTHQITDSELVIINQIMFRLNKPFSEAVVLAEECRQIHLSYVLNKKVEDEISTKYDMAISEVIEKIIRGEILPVKNLIMKKDKSRKESDSETKKMF